MPNPSARPRHDHSPLGQHPIRALGLALLVGTLAIGPVAAADPIPSPSPSAGPAHAGAPAGGSIKAAAAGDLTLVMTQAATTYDPATNWARVQITLTPTTPAVPWAWSIAVRGTTVASGSSSDASVTKTVVNNCSITTQSVTAQVTDNAGNVGSAAATLDRSLCPPPPNVPHAQDRILAGPTLTENSFVDRLRAVASPALPEARSIYRALVAGGINVSFALGTFHAESHSGTRGYAVITKNWGNILFYDWEIPYGATPYAPGNGYTYAKYSTWLASVRAYVALLNRYHTSGYTTVSSASAHWLGTIEGSDRHLRYLNNIVAVMKILPDDAVPFMTALSVPSASRAEVKVSWSARDNVGVTGYSIKYRKGSGTWSPIESTTARSRTLTLTTGTWQIAVRAFDAAGNGSKWWSRYVRVDAGVPTMTGLRLSQTIVRTADARFTAAWSATDNVGVTRYQWRTRQSPDGAPSAPTSTTSRSGTFRLGSGTWFLEVRASDAVGNWSAWRSARVLVPRDDRAYTFSAGTARHTGSDYFRGTLMTTSAKDAQIVTTTTDGNTFVLIGRVGPRYGKLEVTVDGVATVVDSGYLGSRRATSYHNRVLLFSTRFAPGPHTVTIRNLATTGRPTIAIDGLGFAR